jgi:hypothetical protein
VGGGTIPRRFAISILACNFEAGDHEVALRWFRDEQDRDVKHTLGIDLRQLLEKRPDPRIEIPTLLSLYEYGPSSTCREFTVHRLIELDALPEDIRHECEFDANEEIFDRVTGPANRT